MNSSDKKTIVLQILIDEVRSLSLPELLTKLGSDYTERTVRRWLSGFAQDGLVEKIGQKRATKYQAIKTTTNAQQIEISKSHFSKASLGILQQIRRPIYERMPVSYNEKWFNSYQPNQTYYLTLNTRTNLQQAGVRAKKEDPAGTYAHQIFNRLLIDLSYNSSRLEGNTYSLLDTKRLLLEGTSAVGKLDEEKIMILNHKEAIRYLVDSAPSIDVSTQTICTLHYLLADGLVEAKYAGKVRDHSVRISGSTYMPFEDPNQLKQSLNNITKKAAMIEDPYEQSIFLLIHLSYLQAFADVNKRTARLSANIPLVTKNYVPQSFNEVERDDYTSAMTAIYELQDVRPLTDLYVFSYLRTCQAYDSTIKAMGFDEVRVRYRQQRREMIRHLVLKNITGVAMSGYISSQIHQLIPPTEQQQFTEDLWEDLKEIDISRIAGLGITMEQLNRWLKKSEVSLKK
jgi:prophage maintenance system killer protein/Fe2+ or Zn2+ uptake regulation protein